MRLICVLFLFISSCTSYETSPVMDEEMKYERDITMHVSMLNGNSWTQYYLINGSGVMPKADAYKIKVYPPGKADMITVTSCHVNKRTPNPEKKSKWFKKGYYEFEVPFKNTVDAENLCSFDIGVFEKDKGRHAWGLIAISDASRYNMPATMKCNGTRKRYNGTSVCQAKEGLIQGYEFKEKVSVAKVVGCEIANISSDQKYSATWRFVMPRGECEVFFVSYDDPIGKVHQAFLYGYGKMPIRGLK